MFGSTNVTWPYGSAPRTDAILSKKHQSYHVSD